MPIRHKIDGRKNVNEISNSFHRRNDILQKDLWCESLLRLKGGLDMNILFWKYVCNKNPTTSHLPPTSRDDKGMRSSMKRWSTTAIGLLWTFILSKAKRNMTHLPFDEPKFYPIKIGIRYHHIEFRACYSPWLRESKKYFPIASYIRSSVLGLGTFHGIGHHCVPEDNYCYVKISSHQSMLNSPSVVR